jgi:hypothetical protein
LKLKLKLTVNNLTFFITTYNVILFEIQTDATLIEFFKTCTNQIITEWKEEVIKGNKISKFQEIKT